jgi:hypothetical protein
VSQPELREISIDDIRQLVEPDYMARAVEVFDGNLVIKPMIKMWIQTII